MEIDFADSIQMTYRSNINITHANAGSDYMRYSKQCCALDALKKLTI